MSLFWTLIFALALISFPGSVSRAHKAGLSTTPQHELSSRQRLKAAAWRKIAKRRVWHNRRSLAAVVDGKQVYEKVAKPSARTASRRIVLPAPAPDFWRLGDLFRPKPGNLFSSPGFEVGPRTKDERPPRKFTIRRLAIELVYQYGGPETAWDDCAGWIEAFGIKTCRPGVKFLQHGLWVSMYGPDDVDPGQLVSIKDSCMASAIAVHIIPVVTAIDIGVDAIFSQLPAMEGMFRTCIETTEALSKIVVPEFRLEIEKSEWW